MDKKRKDGYVAGLGFLVVFAIFLPVSISTGWNTTGQIFGIFTLVFGVLGVGSLWKPDSVGAIALQFLENFGTNEEEGSDSHNKQIQKKSSGSVQVVATHGANVNVNVSSGKKGQTENPQEKDEQKEFLRKEKIEVTPTNGYYYEFEFSKGDRLKGEISSTSRIDVYFFDEFNFDKWNRGRKYFEPEDSNEAVLETNIDYEVPVKGTWYMVIENNGRKSAAVKVLLY
jgi:hypothetical protein